MRIWHESLIPKLCRQHLLAMWREGLGAYAIITQDKKGYRNHPAVKEFENDFPSLYVILRRVRAEMLNRGYHPKELPGMVVVQNKPFIRVPWQPLSKQIEVLKAKKCKCNV